jgi:hypothetical protein
MGIASRVILGSESHGTDGFILRSDGQTKQLLRAHFATFLPFCEMMQAEEYGYVVLGVEIRLVPAWP